MLIFWIVAALLIVAALAFVLVPLLRAHTRAGPTVREANLAVLRGQRRDIDSDVALGLLPREAREAALAELAARADEDLDTAAEAPAGSVRKPWIVAGLFAALIPAVTVGLYLWVGAPAATDPKAVAAAPAQPGDHQIEEMVVALEQKMKERPDDVQGWMLLARSYAATGKMPKALEAYAHLAKIAPQEASVLADYADALAMAQGRSLSGKPMELIREALKLDPAQWKALSMAATEAFARKDYATAIGYWERALAAVPAGSELAQAIQANIAEARRLRSGN